MLTSGGSQLLASAARAFSTSGAAQAIAPAVSAAANRGLLASLFSSTKRIDTPLDTPLDGVENVEYAVPAAPPKTEMTTLASGVKIASEDTPVSGWVE